MKGLLTAQDEKSMSISKTVHKHKTPITTPRGMRADLMFLDMRAVSSIHERALVYRFFPTCHPSTLEGPARRIVEVLALRPFCGALGSCKLAHRRVNTLVHVHVIVETPEQASPSAQSRYPPRSAASSRMVRVSRLA